MAFRFTVEGQNPQLVHVIGAINETSDLTPMFSGLTDDVVFSLEGVDKINSIGILNWVKAFTPFAKGRSVRVRNLSYPLANQAASISNLFAGAEIESSMAPYYCSKCQAEYLVPVERKEFLAAGAQIPNKNCSHCGSEMTFEELPTYFEFFKD